MEIEYSIHTDRGMLIHLLQESDPDEVVNCLRITSTELLLAFPKKLEVYIHSELAGDTKDDDYEEDDTEY